jgi:hypothetical protein
MTHYSTVLAERKITFSNYCIDYKVATIQHNIRML